MNKNIKKKYKNANHDWENFNLSVKNLILLLGSKPIECKVCKFLILLSWILFASKNPVPTILYFESYTIAEPSQWIVPDEFSGVTVIPKGVVSRI